MNRYFLVKINFLILILGLGVVIYTIWSLRKHGLSEDLEQVLAISGPTQTHELTPQQPAPDVTSTSCSISDGNVTESTNHDTPSAVAAAPTKPITWCRTRVKALRWPGGRTLQQRGLKWELVGHPPNSSLHQVSIEKWFGKYCTVDVLGPEPDGKSSGTSCDASPTRTPEPTRRAATPAFTVEFIKGDPAVLYRLSGDQFIWEDKRFRSTKLARALDELDALLR